MTAEFYPDDREAAAALVLAAPCLVVIAEASSIGGYVYDSAEPGNNLANVIERSQSLRRVQDRSDVHSDSMLTDLVGGHYDRGTRRSFT